MSGPIASYYSSVSIRVDEKGIAAVDRYLAQIEKKLSSSKMGQTPVKVRLTSDFDKFAKTIQSSVNKHLKAKPLTLHHVAINQSKLNTALNNGFAKAKADIGVTVNKSSLREVRRQVKSFLENIPITFKAASVRAPSVVKASTSSHGVSQGGSTRNRLIPSLTANVGPQGAFQGPSSLDKNTATALRQLERTIARLQAGGGASVATSRGYREALARISGADMGILGPRLAELDRLNQAAVKSGRYRGYGEEAARRRQSITGRGDPSATEYLSRGGDTVGNRRYSDAIANNALKGVGGNGMLNALIRTGGQGLMRAGGQTVLGRGLQLGGLATGGTMGAMRANLAGLVISSLLSTVKHSFGLIGTIITAPFKLLGSAITTVTDGFYRLAQALIPVAIAGHTIDSNVRRVSSETVALNTIGGKVGTDAATEKAWLRNMSDTEGLNYKSIMPQYTSWLGSTAPIMGLESSRKLFESFTQYGTTHGATKQSFEKAFYALSQMGGKGQVMSKSLN